MDTKLRGRVDGKMIVSESNNQMYIYAQADVMGNKELKNGDIVTFIAQGVRAVEIEKFDTTGAARRDTFAPSPNASTQKVSSKFTNSNNNPKVAGFEFMDENAQKRNKKKNSLTQSYISNIKKFGIFSVILPLICIGAIFFFIDELTQVIKFGLAYIGMLSESFVLLALIAICFLVVILSHIIPLHSAFANFSYASRSTSILKQNVNFNMFFILTFLAIIGCGYYFGFNSLMSSLEVVGGIVLLLLLTYFYKLKMFYKASKISGIWLFFVAILIEFVCVAGFLAIEILNVYQEFKIFTLGGIILVTLLYIISYLMVSQIENDSRNIWNVR